MKRIFKILKSQKGVTLIELLVVVVILGIIAAVAVPAVMSSQADTYANTNQLNLAIVNEAVQRYVIDHSGKYPTVNGAIVNEKLTSTTNSAGTVTPTSSGKLYGPYLQSMPTVFSNDGSIVLYSWKVDSSGKAVLPVTAAE